MNRRLLDFASVRERLARSKGKEYWRSLEELADTPELQELLHREYPRYVGILDGPINRRQFLQVLGASLALAGLTACGINPPPEKIIPYVKQPELTIAAKSLYYATAMTLGGYATGLLVENHMGRPTKVEGNPDHPASLGATDAFAQAVILSLYDPDRSQVVTYNGQIRTYDSLLREMRGAVEALRANKGVGLRILTGTVTSPTLTDQMRRLLTTFPNAKWHQYEPLARGNTRAGARLAFSQDVDSVYHLARADVILSLDCDLFSAEPGSLRYAHDWATRRRPDPAQGQNMNRLYVVESSPSLTGAKADHRLPLRAVDVEAFARAVAQGLGVPNVAPRPLPQSVPAQWIPALVRDLQQHSGTSLVVAGESQPPVVHALAHAMNVALQSVGKSVVYTGPVEANPTDQMGSLRDLIVDLSAGRVDLLLILGGNPVYDAPADFRFGDYVRKANTRLHLGLYQDETSAVCQWHVPQAHLFEAWSDARAFDGTATIIQPMIAPLYGGKSIHEMIGALADQPDMPGHDIVQNYWKRQHAGADFDLFWRKALNDGIVPNTVSQTMTPVLATGWADNAAQSPPNTGNAGMEIVFRPDPTVYDGRFANNGWLQELPKPLTRLTWDNVALLSPATARRLGLEQDPTGKGGEHGSARVDVIDLRYQGRTVRAPVWIIPGHPDESVTVFLGYGRARAGKVGTGIGYNAYSLRTSSAPWFDQGLETGKTGEKYELASVQQHNLMEGRGLVRSATLADFVRNPNFAREGEVEHPPSLYPDYEYKGYAWGMAIDVNACIGCNACVVACQAENNIPVVGKEQVLKSREMHWLRIDTYYKGSVENPETFFEPVPCMHCENAPCEVVCPVAATVHSSEGLNEMVYNRCVGTRYCSNNCPYKVRRFNFLQFADWDTASLKAMRNPNVTVRSRGVMEKCTYCVQRIDLARINAEREGRTVQDGEIVTACAAACPADAIVFGNINDKNSRVARIKAGARDYALLSELNTRPRTSYEAVVRNPNPEIESA